ncbi:CIC11C00000000889 [Sungouiella intermedia]|uniref:CIC11C00000000889 n=1 Tax=Sungouiella intermedia TaxID=45354 RepID=A0A1L0BPB3_9ASCO|nr:CIC11C00000000889 [[Candida] intermedia]
MADLKRPHDELPNFDDPQDLVNAVISTLQQPEEKTYVAMYYANDKNLATEVQAYAKIAGCDWTFYVKLLAILIGRNTENAPPAPGLNTPQVDIDLGPAKVVSRQHAAITYNIDLRCWEFKVLGRNGARVDGAKIAVGADNATPLHSGAILDIGGTQMMFILPDAPPSILQKVLLVCLARYKDAKKVPKSNAVMGPAGSMGANHTPSMSMGLFLGMTNFQMFDKSHLSNSPSQVSAVSLQNNLDQDLSREEAKDIKPPYSYATMITQAILLNPDGVMSLAEIYAWILSHYAYYKYLKTGWQNSIRHNLSLNKAFEKVPRRPNEPGKGMKWQISDSYKQDFMKKIQNGTLLKSRRGSSVSRTLQIHLATHSQLPDSQAMYKPETHSGSFDQRQGVVDHNPNIIKRVNQPMPYTNMPTNQVNHINHVNQINQANQANQVNPANYGNSQPHYIPNGYPAPYGGNNNYQQLSMMLTEPQNRKPVQQLPAFNGPQGELASPIRRSSSTDSNIPKLPQIGNPSFSLPHPNGVPGGQNFSSGMNTYKPSSQPAPRGASDSSAAESSGIASNNSSHHRNSSLSNQNITAPSTSNNTDLGLGFNSPKKIAPLEAFTPERGSKASGKMGNGSNINQSSPAFWNFVQFSTPNGQTPGRKNSEESDGQTSPTLNRGKKGVQSNGSPSDLTSNSQNMPNDSPTVKREV